MNPILLWVPSQNGLTTEPPQRHSEIHVLPSGVDLPLSLRNWNRISFVIDEIHIAVHSIGPFFRISIVTSAIPDLRLGEALTRYILTLLSNMS